MWGGVRVERMIMVNKVIMDLPQLTCQMILILLQPFSRILMNLTIIRGMRRTQYHLKIKLDGRRKQRMILRRVIRIKLNHYLNLDTPVELLNNLKLCLSVRVLKILVDACIENHTVAFYWND